MNIWIELGIEATRDLREIKRAYAQKLKLTHPEDNPDGFQRLRAAYERALKLAEQSRDVDRATNNPINVPIVWPAEEGTNGRRAEETPSHLTPEITRPAVSPQAAARAICQRINEERISDRNAVLEEVLRQQGWEQIDFQAALETAIARELIGGFEEYVGAVEVFVRHYQWEDNQRRIQQRGDSLVAELLTRWQAREWRVGIEASKDADNARRKQALALLRGKPNEAAFRKFARWSKNLEMMYGMLQRLNTTHRAALRFEVDMGSARWWDNYLSKAPLAIDKLAGLIFTGMFVGPIVMSVICELIKQSSGFDLLADPKLAILFFIPSIFSMLALNRLNALWRRGFFQKFELQRERWRHERIRRYSLVVLSSLLVLATAFVSAYPPLAIAAVIVTGLFAYRYNARYAISVVLVFAWPLQTPLSFLVNFVYDKWPGLQNLVPEAPTILFPHMVATVLFVPFMRLCINTRKLVFKKPLQNESRFALQCTVLVCLLSIVAMAATGLFDQPKPIEVSRAVVLKRPPVVPEMSSRSDSQPGQSHFALPSLNVGMPRTVRPVSEIDDFYKKNKPAFNKVFSKYFHEHPAIAGAKVELGYTVEPSGVVSEAHVISSQHNDPELTDQLIAVIRQGEFSSNGYYLASHFRMTFSGKPGP